MNTVTRTCDECGQRYEIREDIAVDVDAWAEQGEPYVCGDCLPDDPYDEDEPSEYERSGDLEDELDRTAERFPDGKDVVSIQCSNCHENTNVPDGELLLCECGQILNNTGKAAKGFVHHLGADYYQRYLNAGMIPVTILLDDADINMLEVFNETGGKINETEWWDEIHAILSALGKIIASDAFQKASEPIRIA